MAYWLGKIEAGRVSNLTAMGADLLPTMAAISGTAIPDNLKLDGINLLPHLIENKEPAPRPLFWSHNNQLAIRQGDFKLVTDKSFSKPSLYNLRVDLGEKMNIATQHPDLVQQLAKILKAWHGDVNRNVKKRT